MKKALICFVVLATLFCCGCIGGDLDAVSYLQSAYLIGECDEFRLTVVSGVRESPYVMDGEKGDLVGFCTLTLKPKSEEGSGESYTYEVDIEGEIYTGTLHKDTFGTTLSGDIGVDVGNLMTSVTLKRGQESFTVMLENMTSNALISSTDALDIAKRALSDSLSNLDDDDSREIYIKFVSDILGEESVYYWYVAFVGEGGKYSAVLIDIVSGDIIAKRG